MSEDTGKGAYGTRHVMEEQMQADAQGVFEPRSNADPENKMLDAPERKATPRSKRKEPAT